MDDEEVEPEEANTQQEPSGSAANQSADETKTSNDEIETEEIDLPELDLGMAHVDQDKKPNKKGSNGTISKTIKKPTRKYCVAMITRRSHHHHRASITTGTTLTPTRSKLRTPTTAIERGDRGRTTIGITIQDNSLTRCKPKGEEGR